MSIRSSCTYLLNMVKEKEAEPGVVAHTIKRSIQEAEAGRSSEFKAKSGVHKETLSTNKQIHKPTNKKEAG